ncbi:uncharacterized protein N7498_009093 [Penicillium cinerascens]|uniref:Uncharacterized protein n=1 Tax=Penicillium cinerascens TaxID=70096 RepID=A0A9W9J3V0_9EURO|nr:uncharacterized protein N7498_009093 [Penicillium cinerascens]KAJ5190108.1 hypothetical protein N7498_009093 [Penicillium cinerascens]
MFNHTAHTEASYAVTAEEHPTWECPSTRGGMIRIKCANCSGNHRPTSLDCSVKREAKAKAEQIPQHESSTASAPASARAPARVPEFNFTPQAGLKDSVHAPANRFDFQFSQSASQRTVPLASQRTAPPASQPASQPAAPEDQGPPKGSKNKSKTSTFSDKSLPTQPELTETALTITKHARNSRSQQRMLQDPISDPERLLQHKKRRFEEPQIDIENDQVMQAQISISSSSSSPTQPCSYLSAREQFAPAPTEETLPPSHGLHFSDIFDVDADIIISAARPQNQSQKKSSSTRLQNTATTKTNLSSNE